MPLRRLIGLVAMLGVLLHAGLIVRHASIMLNATLLHSELVSSLGVICHGDGSTTRLPGSEVPALPDPSDGQSNCPICTGVVAAAAVLPSLELAIHQPDRATARMAIVGETIALRLVAAWPPSRGPPVAT